MKKIYIALLLILITSPVLSKIAVIPYRVNTADKQIREYEKLLSTAIIVMKDTDVLSTHETRIGLREIGISQGGAVSEEDLKIFGMKYGLDLILTGTVRVSGKTFTSENVLFSVNTGRTISRNKFTETSILKLATKEIAKTLGGGMKDQQPLTNADIAFILDTSYNMRSQWGSVRRSIEETASAFIEKFGMNTRIYIIPYSERRTHEDASVYINSSSKLKKGLARLHPGGGASIKSFTSALNYSLRSIKWRPRSVKKIIVVNNSSMKKFSFPEKYGFPAKRKGIRISAVNGSENLKGRDNLSRLPELTDGSNLNITYHQKIYDSKGKPYNLYLERGRLYYSLSHDRLWKEGMSTKANHLRSGGRAEEVLTSGKGLSPSSMADILAKNRDIITIQKDRIRDNVSALFSKIFEGSSGKRNIFQGKALISDGPVSIWIRAESPAQMKTLENYREKGFYFKSGFRVLVSEGNAYGIRLIPVRMNIDSLYLTEYSNARLSDIIKNRGYYIKNGIGRPPVWFLNIKVERTERFSGKKDVRDEE